MEKYTILSVLRFTMLSLLILVIGSLRGYSQTNNSLIEIQNKCITNPNCEDFTTFTDTHKDAVSWQWSVNGVTSDKQVFQTAFNMPGPYNVTLIRTLKDGTSSNVTQDFEVGKLPPQFQKWFADTTICPGGSLTLDPYPDGAPEGVKYIWYPKGDTTQTLTVTESGCYSVEVLYPDGCSIQDLVNVKLCLEPAGQQGAKWYFGNNAGLDFAGGNPQAITDGKLNTKEGASTISNSKGELQFYSDGITIYNADGDKMPCAPGVNCDPLLGSSTSTQSVLIVPQPVCKGCDYLYNVFTTTSISDTEKKLSVSVVDMRLNEGKGAIIEINRPLANTTTERLVASRNDLDSTYWVLSHDYGTNKFRVFHATPSGLIESNSFDLGRAHDIESMGEGQMKFSSADSTGKRQLAVVIPGPPNNYVELFSFNDETGELSGPTRSIDLGPSPPKAYGVEFSPNGQNLFISFQGEGNTKSLLAKYDLSLTGDSLLVASAMKIDSSSNEKYGSLQFAPNGSIYMAIEGSEYLASIGSPDDSTGLVRYLDYNRRGVNLGAGNKSQLGLPNFVQNFTQESNGPGFDAQGFCVYEPTIFTASPLCQPLKDTYQWNFGDGDASTIPSKETEVQHIYKAAGKYTVTLTAGNDCLDTLFTKDIEIYDVPKDLELGDPVRVCAPYYDMESPVDAKNYAWINLSTRRIISREKKARFYQKDGGRATISLSVWNDPDGLCMATDTLYVTLDKPQDFDLGLDQAMCKDSSMTLKAEGPSWREFKWSTGETSREIIVKTPGTYWAEVKDSQGCMNMDTLVIAELPKAKINAVLVPPTGCTTADGSITIGSINPAPLSNYQFVWRNLSGTEIGSGTQIVNLKEGAYTVRVSGHEQACESDSTIVLKSPANNLNIRALVTNADCQDPESGFIKLQIVTGAPTQYAWWNNQDQSLPSTADTLGNLAPGSYKMKAIDAGGCTFELTAIVVALDQTNLADLGPDLGKCEGQTIVLSPLAINFPHNNYLWNTNETTHTIEVTTDGTYTLTAWNTENGCKGTDEIVVRSVPAPAVNLAPEFALCLAIENSQVVLNPIGRSDYKYYWYHSNDSTRQVSVNQLGNYVVNVTNVEGCSVDFSTDVVDKCEPRFVVPDAFSPNDDGFNDRLAMFAMNISSLDFKIYNRWGEVIFATDDIDEHWDGFYKGVKVQPGVYTWRATYKSSDYPERSSYTIRGAVTVIR